MPVISASILNGDLAHLADTAQTVAESGAKWLHFDVMDGSFVDNISFGLPVLQALRPHCRVPVDVHLMIVNPLHFIARFAEAGADMISFHLESGSDIADTVRTIHACGIPAGIALSPDTPAEAVFPYLPLLGKDDFVLMMTVYPGLGGQSFMPEVLPKIQALRQRIDRAGLPVRIEVDGGINAETGLRCRKAGAEILVAGSYLLCSENPAEAVRSLRAPADGDAKSVSL